MHCNKLNKLSLFSCKLGVQRCLQTQCSLYVDTVIIVRVYTVIIVTTNNLNVHVLNHKLINNFSYCLIVITDVFWLF